MLELRKSRVGPPVRWDAVGPVDDPAERQAEAVAARVVRAPTYSAEVLSASRRGQSVSSGAAAGGSGQALDATTRADMEARFGHDFSRVRIHTESATSRSLDALAYSSGSQIAFAPGQYSPQSDRGRRLLAHELTHVIQQRSANTPQPIRRFHLPHGVDPRHQANETALIARTFADMVNTLKAIIASATVPGGLFGDTVNMDNFVLKAGGIPAS